MPEMDGYALGQAIKTDPALRETVLVLLTSAGQRSQSPRILAAGFAALVVKPVRPSQLMNALATAWGVPEQVVVPTVAVDARRTRQNRAQSEEHGAHDQASASQHPAPRQDHQQRQHEQ